MKKITREELDQVSGGTRNWTEDFPLSKDGSCPICEARGGDYIESVAPGAGLWFCNNCNITFKTPYHF
ncbi:MAG: hypothetical protein K6F99_01895 [Lachnospiraceae bacterium]|nr:hypothetical protein [Lachnospiraceae bacterium]